MIRTGPTAKMGLGTLVRLRRSGDHRGVWANVHGSKRASGMGTSSARPDDPDRFAARSRGADDALRADDRRLRSDYANFQDGSDWGVLDIGSLLAGFGTFIDYNEIDARWVAKSAAAFRHAGGDGSIK